jgi:hypothetical protein
MSKTRLAMNSPMRPRSAGRLRSWAIPRSIPVSLLQQLGRGPEFGDFTVLLGALVRDPAKQELRIGDVRGKEELVASDLQIEHTRKGSEVAEVLARGME